jgi:hypothetical protein
MATIMTAELRFYFVIGLSACPAPMGALAVLYYNVKTFQIVQSIQNAYQQQGATWPFWTNQERVLAFVLNPESLLRDVPAIARSEKFLLIRHRGTMKSYLIKTFVYMFSSFGIAILLLLTIALLRR